MSIDTSKLLVSNDFSGAVPIHPVDSKTWDNIAAQGNLYLSGLAETAKFEGKPGQLLVIPSKTNGVPKKVYIGVNNYDMWTFATAAKELPERTYRIEANLNQREAYQACVGWALARYSFLIQQGAVHSTPGHGPKLIVPQIARPDLDEIENEIKATWAVRDRINATANILNTTELALETLDLAARFNAASGCISGKKLEKEFPLIHTVGRASANEPHLAHFSWTGNYAGKNPPTILLVGKGIAFDSGGLDIKPSASMFMMKKDMGGAATALGLAEMIMANDLPVRLKVVIPIAENAVSGNAFRPSDVITARDGTEVEIGNTDAEGRLVLADALTFGLEDDDWKPDYIIDYATLTGAQRVADGTEVAGLFSNDIESARKLEDLGMEHNDLLQFHHMYDIHRGLIRQTKHGGEITSSPASGPGAANAAFFLEHFVKAAKPGAKWFHFDMNGMNVAAKPGRPAGGEAMGMRAMYRFLRSELRL